MPDIQNTLRTLVVADAGVSALVSTRVYADVLPQKVTLPAITSFIVDTVPYESLAGIVDVAVARIQYDCYAVTRPASIALADAVRLALEKQHRGDNSGQFINAIQLVGGEYHGHDAPEDGSGKWRFITSLDFRVFYRTTTS